MIGEQVQQRERESRNAELAIIRSTAVLCAHYGEVEVDRLIQLLDLNPGDAQRSLKRLIDEHLILESRLGVLGGLHMLRSKALLEASHDEAVYRVSDTLWRFFTATTRDSLPRVVQSVLANADSEDETRFLSRLAEILGSSSEVDLWTAILTGLGLATLERHVFTFISILEQHGVKRAFWSLASTFVAAGTDDLPELSQFEQWPSLRDAVLAFRALPKQDLRPACLKQLPEGAEVPHCHGVRQANKMLSCLVPIREGEAVAASFEIDLAEDDDLDIGEVAMLLSTAYLIGPDRAKSIVDSLGGEQALLDRFCTQTPWATKPVIESDGPHGRTIRSNWFQVSEQYQSDPHDAVCEICETLIALVPDADAAASDAIDPLGRPVAIGDFAPASKHMPRQKLPARTRVAWNVAFRQVLLTRVGAGSLTDYAQKMGPLVGGTEKVFRTLTEKWIKGKGLSNANALAAEINKITDGVNALAYAAPKNLSTEMAERTQGSGDVDTLGALLTGILGNLVTRLGDIKNAKAAATFAGSLADQAREHLQSEIWRTSSSPPLQALADLSARLDDVVCILHERSYDGSPSAIQAIVSAARKARLNRSTAAAARQCRTQAKWRFSDRLRALKRALKHRGINARCLSRAIDKSDSVYWPAREVGILMKMPDLEIESLGHLDDGLDLGQQHLGNDWPFRLAPVVGGQVLASLALRPSSLIPLPDRDFVRDFSEHIDLPVLSSEAEQRLEEGFEACHRISAILTCRGTQELHPEEEQALSEAIKSFKLTYESVEDVSSRTGLEHWLLVFDYLTVIWTQIVEEHKAVEGGKVFETPFCRTAHQLLAGQDSESGNQLAAIRMLMLKAECGLGADDDQVD